MALSLTKEKARTYSALTDKDWGQFTVKASTTVYVGQVLATDVANHAGKAIPWDSAGTFTSAIFIGFAEQTVVQTSTSTLMVRVRGGGDILIPLASVTGGTGAVDVGTTVYASNDDTFTLTSTNNLAIGKIEQYVAGEGFWIAFQANSLRSI